MGKVVKGVLGGVGSIVGLGGKTPKVGTEAETDVKAAQAETNKAAQALYSTEGGVLGSLLDPEQVSKRSTLLGN